MPEDPFSGFSISLNLSPSQRKSTINQLQMLDLQLLAFESEKDTSPASYESLLESYISLIAE